MNYDVAEIVDEIRVDETTFLSFLDLCGRNYRYSFLQLLLLYKQGYTVEEDLLGYNYYTMHMGRHQQMDNSMLIRKFILPVGSTTVVLFSRLNPNKRGKTRDEQKKETLIGKFEECCGLPVVNMKLSEYYRLSETELKIVTDLSSETFGENITLAAIEFKLHEDELKKELVRRMYAIKSEFKLFDKYIANATAKQVHDSLAEAFEFYQDIIYSFKEKYFTINEVAQLNQCRNCEDIDSLTETLKHIPDVQYVLFNKLMSISASEIHKMLLTLKKGELTHYPPYYFKE